MDLFFYCNDEEIRNQFLREFAILTKDVITSESLCPELKVLKGLCGPTRIFAQPLDKFWSYALMIVDIRYRGTSLFRVIGSLNEVKEHLFSIVKSK